MFLQNDFLTSLGSLFIGMVSVGGPRKRILILSQFCTILS